MAGCHLEMDEVADWIVIEEIGNRTPLHTTDKDHKRPIGWKRKKILSYVRGF